MKIYALRIGDLYAAEGDVGLQGLYATKELAEEALRLFKKSRYCSRWTALQYIEEWDLIEESGKKGWWIHYGKDVHS